MFSVVYKDLNEPLCFYYLGMRHFSLHTPRDMFLRWPWTDKRVSPCCSSWCIKKLLKSDTVINK